MYKFLAKNGQLIAFGVGAAVTVIFLGSIFSGLEQFSALDKEASYGTTIFDFGIYATIFLVVLGFAAALLFSVYQVATNPKGSIKGIAGIIALVAIFFIGQSVAGADTGVVAEVVKKFEVTPGQSAAISGGIMALLTLVGIAVLSFVVSEVSNFFK